jgi:asparagine synthase (glutamine-hydrolysing)
MCGIAGYIGMRELGEASIASAMSSLGQRGPDHSDHRIFPAGEQGANVTLIHTRLAIIDLDARSNQPFSMNGYTVVFNGEIYNYIELRRELITAGVEFRTTSDTEVLLAAYMHYGQEFTEKLEGMWSFAIWDPFRNVLLLSRDRFGEKPLYIYRDGQGLFFASEVKALFALSGIRPDINFDQLLRYNLLGYKSLYKKKQIYFRDIQEVASGMTMTITTGLQVTESRYWQPRVNERSMSLAEAIEGSRHYLTESVRLRMRSDVPVAFCLSGGVDSVKRTHAITNMKMSCIQSGTWIAIPFLFLSRKRMP